MGKLEEADIELRVAAQRLGDGTIDWVVAECVAELAEIALAAGAVHEVRRLAARVLGLAVALKSAWLLATTKRLLAWAAAREGAESEARRLAYEALELQRDNGYRLEAVRTLETLATLEAHRDPALAARLLGAAAAARRSLRIRHRWDPDGRSAAWAAIVASLAPGERRRAWHDGYALSLADALAYAFRGRGARKRPTVGWASLTPTELRVAECVAQGLSNSAIAARLFISPGTVKTHLSHIYTKVSVAHRTELAALVVREQP